jgi:hypothetical protein
MKTIMLDPPVNVGNGVSISQVEIDAIMPHENGAFITTKQGVSVQISHKDAPEGVGDYRLDKASGEVTLDGLYAAVGQALQAKYPPTEED